MTDRKKFFDGMRQTLFGGRLSQAQVDGTNAILDEWACRGFKDIRWLAYMLATVKWETASTMQPIEEYGRGAGYAYGVTDPVTGQRYYGRGFVQLTWKRNYDVMGRLLGVDLVNHPECALELPVATQILFEGMMRGDSGVGDFTGLALDDCFNATKEDWTRARAIINGTDHAAEIGQLGRMFYGILKSAAPAESDAAQVTA
jgi:putative chitinase